MKKLSLTKETMLTLNAAELAEVQGGAYTQVANCLTALCPRTQGIGATCLVCHIA